jgi:hypothetical protein
MLTRLIMHSGIRDWEQWLIFLLFSLRHDLCLSGESSAHSPFANTTYSV